MMFVAGVLLVFGVLFVVVLVYCSFFWDCGSFLGGSPRCWVGPFECGFIPFRLSEDYFSCSFFLLLVLFVVFDLEVSLLLNIPCEGLLFKNLVSYLVFVVCLVFGFVFEVECGYVSWSV